MAHGIIPLTPDLHAATLAAQYTVVKDILKDFNECDSRYRNANKERKLAMRPLAHCSPAHAVP